LPALVFIPPWEGHTRGSKPQSRYLEISHVEIVVQVVPFWELIFNDSSFYPDYLRWAVINCPPSFGSSIEDRLHKLQPCPWLKMSHLPNPMEI
jgi:hypothetical protein